MKKTDSTLNKLFYSYTLTNFTFLLVLISSCLLTCKKEEPKASSIISINTPQSFDDYIYFVTENPTGKLLHSAPLVNGQKKIKYSLENSIDLTYGKIDSTDCYLTTIRNIKSDFVFKNEGCINEYAQVILYGQKYELTIEGLNNYVELFIPTSFNDTGIIIEDNSLKILSKTFNRNSLIFTVLENRDSIYKSFVLDYNDWDNLNGTLKKVVNIEEYTELDELNLNFQNTGHKRLNIYSRNNQNELVTLSSVSTHQYYNEGESLKIFNPNNSSDYLITANLSSTDGSYQIIKTQFNSIPETLNFYSPDYSIPSWGNGGFEIDPIYDAEVVILEFAFKSDQNETSHWKILQSGEDGLSYSFPDFPEEYSGLKEMFLKTPVSLYVKSYTESNSDLSSKIKTQKFNRFCYEYKYNQRYFLH